jgi:hypothetical protein
MQDRASGDGEDPVRAIPDNGVVHLSRDGTTRQCPRTSGRLMTKNGHFGRWTEVVRHCTTSPPNVHLRVGPHG